MVSTFVDLMYRVNLLPGATLLVFTGTGMVSVVTRGNLEVPRLSDVSSAPGLGTYVSQFIPHPKVTNWQHKQRTGQQL